MGTFCFRSSLAWLWLGLASFSARFGSWCGVHDCFASLSARDHGAYKLGIILAGMLGWGHG